MVSYYNHSAMYRHQQALSSQPGQFHHQVNPWYNTGYHHQGNNQMNVGNNGPTTYCMQEEQQMWHHHHPHAVWHQDYSDFISAHPPPPSMQMQMEDPLGQPQQNQQLPSPTVTVSGSEMSSPGGGGSSPAGAGGQSRPAPVRSPYEWIKKTSYQTQQAPGKTRTKDKYRVVYTDHQRVELEKEFYYSRYITIRRKAELAASLGLSERQVKIWFQNRRAKERKQVKKRDEFTHNHKDHLLQHQQLI